MLFDFYRYLNYSDITDYLNCYSTFLMSKNDLKKNILNHRMNVLINSYLNDKNNNNKYDYYYYYLANYKDNYLQKELLQLPQPIQMDITQDFDEDIRDHYRFMITKNPIEPPIDYDEIDRKFLEEEFARQKEKEIINDYNDDEFLDDYDEEFEEFDDYYNDDEDYYNEEYY